ncbi:hypothetical protein ACVGWI_01400, partial [Enterobacter hormaechei]
AIHHRKNNNAQLLPAGAGVSSALRFLGRLSPPPPRNTKPKLKTKSPPRIIKKNLWVALVGALLVSFY